MTKEEAINHIKYGIIENNYPLPKELGKEALDMAIKALEQEPCEDAISRQALINAFPISDTYTLDDIIATIKFQPPVTPTRKVGKWIRHYCNNGNLHHIECSNCHDWHENFLEHKYCPNCGAEMDEGSEESK